MILALADLAASSDREELRKRFGDKSVDLSYLITDAKEQGWKCVEPNGFTADIEGPDDEALRAVFDQLRSRITTTVGERIVGALMCRSSAYGEKSGVNTTLSVLYDSDEVESSYERFKSAFDRVRYDEGKQGDRKIPVLMQKLEGSLTYLGKDYRIAGSFKWPKWPNFDDSAKEAWTALIAPLVQVVRETMDRENGITFFTLRDKAGNNLTSLQIDDASELEEAILDCYLALYHSNKEGGETFGLDDDGRIVAHTKDVVVDVGDEIYLSCLDVPANPVIGAADEGFVVRSHGYAQPDQMSIEVCRGLPSYLVGGLPPLSADRPKGKMLYYFDQDGSFSERINLGHDSRRASLAMGEHYYQTHMEAFSVDSGQVVVLPDDLKGRFSPRLAGRSSQNLLDIARFYSHKKGAPVELEGVYSNGKLHVVQVGESPLPKDLIASLSEVPSERIIYKSESGRGALNFRGDVVIADASNWMLPDEDCLVIGFDETVCKRNAFLYMATDKSVIAEAGRNLAMLASHLAGYACQVVFEAAGEGRTGGVFYVSDVDEFMRNVEPYLETRGSTKLISNVHVEACKAGMQIFKI